MFLFHFRSHNCLDLQEIVIVQEKKSRPFVSGLYFVLVVLSCLWYECMPTEAIGLVQDVR